MKALRNGIGALTGLLGLMLVLGSLPFLLVGLISGWRLVPIWTGVVLIGGAILHFTHCEGRVTNLILAAFSLWVGVAGFIEPGSAVTHIFPAGLILAGGALIVEAWLLNRRERRLYLAALSRLG